MKTVADIMKLLAQESYLEMGCFTCTDAGQYSGMPGQYSGMPYLDSYMKQLNQIHSNYRQAMSESQSGSSGETER